MFVLADYLANFTMDNGQSWSRSFDWPFPHHGVCDCNLVAWSDGGTRRHKCSASAWFVEIGLYEEGSWKFSPLAMGGSYFQTPISSFTAEMLALHECSLFIRSLVQRNSSLTEPFGK